MVDLDLVLIVLLAEEEKKPINLRHGIFKAVEGSTMLPRYLLGCQEIPEAASSAFLSILQLFVAATIIVIEFASLIS